jgi:hypothetical protein
MKDPGDQSTSPAAVPAPQDGPDADARIVELEAEVAALRGARARVGIAADQVAELDASELASERTDRAADAGLAQSARASRRRAG